MVLDIIVLDKQQYAKATGIDKLRPNQQSRKFTHGGIHIQQGLCEIVDGIQSFRLNPQLGRGYVQNEIEAYNESYLR